MTTRRSFFAQLALSVAALSSASILIPQAADAFKWQRTKQWLYVLNPEWVNAPYEIGFSPNAEMSLSPESIFSRGDLKIFRRAAFVDRSIETDPLYPLRKNTPEGPYITPYKLMQV